MQQPTVQRQQPLAAIVYLTQDTPVKRVYLQTSLYWLFRSFNEWCRYPVLIFHQGDFAEKSMAAIQEGVPAGLGGLVRFRQVDKEDFRVPASVTAEVVKANRLIVPDARDLGYRSMCRWWVRHAAKYLYPYEFYMRLDDDSCIEEILNFDPFTVVRDAGIDYAANLLHIEHPLNALGLMRTSLRLLGDTARLRAVFLRCLAEQVIPPENLKAFLSTVPVGLREQVDSTTLDSPIIYYNNFHIARTSLWSRPDIAEFFDAVDRTDGIHRLRWGDAALQTIALVACEGIRLGRFAFRYSKRYEREQGTYVNTDHPLARTCFDETLPAAGRRTGSMTDFEAFNELLASRGIGDLTHVIP